MWERAGFPILWRRKSSMCTGLHCSSCSTRQTSENLSQKPSHRSLIPHPIIPHLVLGGHGVNSVKELIQSQINHFYIELVFPWWLSCFSSLYSGTHSYVTEREESACGQEGKEMWSVSCQSTMCTRAALCQLMVVVEVQQRLILKSYSDFCWH